MVNSIKDLKVELKSKSFKVTWQVRCDIGPDWIGGGRNICFYLDGKPLDDSEFHRMLIDQLINKLHIPASSEEQVIKGDGDIQIVNSELVVKYSTVSNIPYDMEFQFENGEIVLMSVI
jgi:hypothetical protein